VTQNCKQTQRLLDRYLRAELAPPIRQSVEKHLADCRQCSEMLAFHRALDQRLDGVSKEPISLQALVEKAMAHPVPRRPWLIQVFGDPTMKKILFSSTAVVAVLAGALVLVPGRAQGSTAKEKFASVRSALAKAARDGELSVTVLMTATSIGSIKVTLDGHELPPDVPMKITSVDHGDAIDYTVLIDLRDSNFSSIKFGQDRNTLNLVPKGKPGNLDVVHLDPKTGKPIDWTTYDVQQGTTERLYSTQLFNGNSGIGSPKTKLYNSEALQSEPSNDVITLHMKVMKGSGTATVTVKNNS